MPIKMSLASCTLVRYVQCNPRPDCVKLHIRYHVKLHIRHQITGVYLTLNGDNIPNHGYVVISDIGSTNDETALLCHTNYLPDGGTSGGNWYGPDGSPVSGFASVGSGNFVSTNDPGVVRLIRNSAATGTPTEGIYRCQVKDDTPTIQTVYVGLYNSGGGGWFY